MTKQLKYCEKCRQEKPFKSGKLCGRCQMNYRRQQSRKRQLAKVNRTAFKAKVKQLAKDLKTNPEALERLGQLEEIAEIGNGR